jgi:hypothetical protein
MSEMSANLCPFRAVFNFGKSQKSQGAIIIIIIPLVKFKTRSPHVRCLLIFCAAKY